MDGVTGLQLLDITIESVGSSIGGHIGWTIAGISLVLLGIFLVYCCNKEGLNVGGNDIILIVIGAIFIIYNVVTIFQGGNYKEYNKYKCSITDENYHVDLDKYEVVSIEGKLITLKDKSNK